jgi:hypothetical protein
MDFRTLFAGKNPDIAALKQAKDTRGLIAALRSHDRSVHSQAASSIAALGPQAVDDLIRSLATRNRDARLGIIEALAIIRDRKAVPSLTMALSDESSEVRWEAAIALGEIGDPAAARPLVKALSDHDKYVRYGAVFALSHLGWKPEDDTEKAYYFIALQEWAAIRRMGAAAVPALSEILRDRDSAVRSTVVRILGETRDPAAVPALMRSLADDNGSVRWQAVLASQKCGVPFMHIPRGLSHRPKMTKNPLIAAFLNFMLPGLGYGYLGKWWGVMIFQIDITATVWLYKSTGETSTFGILFPLYIVLAVHAWYLAKKMPEPAM